MSACFYFQFNSKYSKNDIQLRVEKIWTGIGREVTVQKDPNGKDILLCNLGYYLGAEDEFIKIKEIVRYLFSISSDEKVFYVIDYDYATDKIARNKITVENIFKLHPPGLIKGPAFTYQLLKPEGKDENANTVP
jgi:hypothetical protein